MNKVRLGDTCEILNGYAFKSENYVTEGIRVIRIANVQKGYIEDKEPQYYPIDFEEDITKYFLYENDLLISLTGNVGRVALLPKEMLPAALNQRVACLRMNAKSDISKDYLFHYLNSDKFENDCITSSKGVAQKNMSTEWLKNYEIPVFSQVKQRHISILLSLIDSLIEKEKLQLQKLDELIKSRFVEMFGDINTNDKGWDAQPLGELCSIVRGGSPRPIEQFLGGDVPWIKIGDATEGESIYLNSTKEHIIKEGVKRSRLVRNGSLIFANCGVSLGFARIITFDGCIHDGWLAMENIDARLNKVFLLQVLNQMTDHFRSIAPAGTQPNLNTAIMKAYRQIIPPMELQKRFISFVSQVEKQKATVKKSIDKLETLKKSLMQEYFG